MTAVRAEEAEAEDQRELPSLETVMTEAARVFEDLEEFSIDEFIFMEGDAVSSYAKEFVEDALQAIAAMVPPKFIIVDGIYQRPVDVDAA